MKQDAMYTAIKNDLETRASAALVTASLDDFEDYLDEPTFDAEKRQMGVYSAGGTKTDLERTEVVLIESQLPGITDIKKYVGVLWLVINDIDPAIVEMDSFNFSYECFYPGEVGDGYGGCIIVFELTFEKQLDSCMEE